MIVWFEGTQWRRHVLIDLKANLLIREKESGKLFVEKYIEYQVKRGKIENVIEALKFLPFDEETIPFIIEISEDAIKSGGPSADKIEEMFYSKSRPEEAYRTALVKSLKNY